MFGLKFITLGVIAFGLGATVFFSLASLRNIAWLSRVASLLALLGFFPNLFVPDGAAAFVFATVLMAGIGGCVSLSSYANGFVLNNTERFLGAILILLYSGVMRVINDLFFVPDFFMPAVMATVAIGLILASFLCRATDFDLDYTGRGRYSEGVWLVLFVFYSFFVTKSLGLHVEAFHQPHSGLVTGVSIITAVLLCLIVQMALNRSVWTMCNVFFIATIGCYALNAAGAYTLANAVYGFKEIGMLVAFYLIGCVTNRFSDFRMHKQLLFLMMPAIIPIYIIPDLLSGTPLLYPVAIGISATLFAVFLLLSPAFSKHLFSAAWSESLNLADMAETKKQMEQTARFESFRLTQREKEVAVLLLQGMEIKQAAAALGVKYDTANFHIKNLYKKLGISRRAELFARFGADGAGRHDLPPKSADSEAQ